MTPKFCPECGSKAPSIAAKFCVSCGTSLDIFAPQKNKSTARQSSFDEDDEDGSDATEVPDIDKLKASISIDHDLGIGCSSFVMGENGLTPSRLAIHRK